MYLYEKICDPCVRLKMIKERDTFISFNTTSNFEKQFDNMMTKLLRKNKDPSMINSVYIVNPTFKSLSIHKMLNNIVYLQENGCAKQWSGFNIQYLQKIQFMNVKTFFEYLWYEQLLGSSTVCESRLEKYVKNILSKFHCLSYIDEALVEKIVEHVNTRFQFDLKDIISKSIDSFISRNDIQSAFLNFLEWKMILGIVPVMQNTELDEATFKEFDISDTCLNTDTVKLLLTIRNKIPSISEVTVILKGSEIECWHLPSETRIDFVGHPNFRLENKEVCFGSKGESLFYAELRVMNLLDKHFNDQSFKRYILLETHTSDKQQETENQKIDSVEQSPLFATLTKAQTALTDETNPLSSHSLARERANNIKDYVSRVSDDMREIENKMGLFLENVLPGNSETFVDNMVQRGMEQYLKKVKPEIEQSEKTIRDYLDKFRINAVKQLNMLPKNMYQFQERIMEINAENNIDMEGFIEEITSTEQSGAYKVPNISSLQDIDKTAIDLKQMQDQVTRYCELALKFMNYFKKAQSVIFNLKTDQSVKELQINTLTQHKKEVVQLAKKYKATINKQVDFYKDKMKELKVNLDKYIAFQDKTVSKTNQTFLNIRDSLILNTGQWVNKERQQQEKIDKRLKVLHETFSKQYNSTCNNFDRPSPSFDIEYLKVDGTIRKDNLDRRIDDNTLSMYMQSLKDYWSKVLNNVISIEETVTKNGVRLYNVNEKQAAQNFMSFFFRILYDKDFFMLCCKNISNYTQLYGVDIATEILVKSFLKNSREKTHTTVIQQTDSYNNQENGNPTGLLLSEK